MGRDELTEDGTSVARSAPPRAGPARYGDRFRRPTTLRIGPVGECETVEIGVEAPARSWPSWLTRGAAGLGLAATAVIGVAISDRDTDPSNASDTPPERSTPLRALPPVAPLDVTGIEAELWESNGFSYEITLTNATDTAFSLLNVSPAMSGTELAWDRTLVLPANQSTIVRVDFLVLNCLAATTSSAPAEVRMVVRGQSADAVPALAQVATVDQAAFIDSAGKGICSQGGGDGGIVLG